MSRYKDPQMQRVYDALLANPPKHRGDGSSCAFFDGVAGTPTANVIPGTQSWAAFQAGKEWARRAKL